MGLRIWNPCPGRAAGRHARLHKSIDTRPAAPPRTGRGVDLLERKRVRDDPVERRLAGGAEPDQPRNADMRHRAAAMRAVGALLKWIGSAAGAPTPLFAGFRRYRRTAADGPALLR
jgi:hypothetical protein